MEKIGLIAGNRKFPLILSQAARQKNYSVVALAVKGETSPQLKAYVDKIYWIGLDEFSKIFAIFKSEGITKLVMAGQISPRRIFSKETYKDQELSRILSSIKDKRADTIFEAIAERLLKEGFELMDSTIFLEEYLPKKGTLTKKEPSFKMWEDVYFGFDMAKGIGFLDIGQAVALKNKVVVAVEAIEGTDNLIRRAGKIAKDGVVIVKVSKPHQDKRFDIPVVGTNTVKNLIKIKAACLAIEAGKTLFIDRESSIALADKAGLSIVAV